LDARRAGRRRRKGWAAAGPQRPAYSGRGHIVSPRAQLVQVTCRTMTLSQRLDVVVATVTAAALGQSGDLLTVCGRRSTSSSCLSTANMAVVLKSAQQFSSVSICTLCTSSTWRLVFGPI